MIPQKPRRFDQKSLGFCIVITGHSTLSYDKHENHC